MCSNIFPASLLTHCLAGAAPVAKLKGRVTCCGVVGCLAAHPRDPSRSYAANIKHCYTSLCAITEPRMTLPFSLWMTANNNRVSASEHILHFTVSCFAVNVSHKLNLFPVSTCKLSGCCFILRLYDPQHIWGVWFLLLCICKRLVGMLDTPESITIQVLFHG